jgi:hypothetical protein
VTLDRVRLAGADRSVRSLLDFTRSDWAALGARSEAQAHAHALRAHLAGEAQGMLEAAGTDHTRELPGEDLAKLERLAGEAW